MNTSHRGPFVVNRPNHRQHLHRHGDARLILFLAGELCESSFDSTASFKRGDLLFRPAYFGHADRAGDNGVQYIRLPLSADALRRHTRRHGWVPLRGQITIDKQCQDTLLSSTVSGDRWLENLNGAAYQWLSTRTSLSQAFDRIAKEPDIRIAHLSESLDIPPYEFARRFLREYGVTPKECRRQARIQRAMQMLAEGGRSLAQIAADTGHCDQSHLTRNLKIETGLTPLDFRSAISARG